MCSLKADAKIPEGNATVPIPRIIITEPKNFPNVDKNFILESKKNNKKIIGIGETGLDFYYNHSDKNIQKKSFAEHIKAALKLNIPLIVHSRSAEKDIYEMLKSANK